jgi:hypothetical protein
MIGSTAMKRDQQIPTIPTTIEKIMASPRFQQGVADARGRRPFPSDYDTWAHKDKSWGYERGRMWGRLVPRGLVLKRNGEVTNEAIGWFMKIAEDIP